MNKRPHKLYKVTVGESTTNDFGQEIQGEETLVFVCDCYEQVMGSSQEYKSANGSSFYYSSKIFIPAGLEEIPTGTRIEIREGDDITIRLQGEVKRFSYQDHKHCRLWV